MTLDEAIESLGLPSGSSREDVEKYAAMTGTPVSIDPTQQEAKNQLMQQLSGMMGQSPYLGNIGSISLEQAQSSPSWSTFAKEAQSYGIDPVQLISDRNKNVSDYQSGGVAKSIGNFMDKSGLGSLITKGTILAAGLGAGSAFSSSGNLGSGAAATGGGSAAPSATGAVGSNPALAGGGFGGGAPASTLGATGAPVGSNAAAGAVAQGVGVAPSRLLAGPVETISAPAAKTLPPWLTGQNAPEWLKKANTGLQALSGVTGAAGGMTPQQANMASSLLGQRRPVAQRVEPQRTRYVTANRRYY